MSELFDSVLARGGVPEQLSERAWLQAMLDFEAGLARSLAAAGLMPAEQAEQIAAACRADRFDAAEIGAQAAATGNPAAPLARALRAAVARPARSRASGATESRP